MPGLGGGGIFKSVDGGNSWNETNTGVTDPYIYALTIDPKNANVIYAGIYGHNLKSVDGGNSWNVINTSYTYNLVIDPKNPNILYAGTRGMGVSKSGDGGDTWNVTGLNNTHAYALAIDPQNPDVLYAGIWGGGVQKSVDGGNTWNVINTGFTSNNIYSIAIDPKDSEAIYVGTDCCVVKSKDGGATWDTIYAKLDYDGYATYGLAIDPKNPNILYAAIWGGGLHKSMNAGDSWIGIGNGASLNLCALAVDLQNPNVLYTGTRDGGFKSVDGGTTWNAIDIPLSSTGYAYEIHALTIDPQNSTTLYAGTLGGGVFKSINAGSTWNSINTGLTNPYVYTTAIDPQDSNIVYAGTGEGGVFKSINGGATWSPINTGLTNTSVYALAIDRQNPNVLYAGTWGGGVFTSRNGGLTWNVINTGLTNTYIFALSIDPQNTNILYTGTWGGGVFKIQQPTCLTPEEPSSPFPSDEATGVSASPILNWSSSNADSYDFYLGTSPNPTYIGSTTRLSFPLAGLNTDTTYYWKIVAENSCGSSTLGPVWSFTTTAFPEINLKQNGVDIPNNTGSYDFGSVNLGAKKAVTFTIQNVGKKTLNLTGSPNVQIGGTYAPDFVVEYQPSTPVSSNGSATFVIAFTPTGTGIRSATVSIASDDLDENPYNFAINGTGVSGIAKGTKSGIGGSFVNRGRT
jgi:photosystem II stability/assembly factor-like uncharacterized protein